MDADWTLSVSQLNEYVRRLLAGDPMLRSLRVQGEISGFKRYTSGHLYFTLKDEEACVSCVMFRSAAEALDFRPQDGQRVTIRGSASLYPQRGQFQLYVETMQREGVGELYMRFEALKRRLTAEGLFDQAIKKEIPAYPRVIGVATSRTGAVLRDIVRVARRRDPNISILLAPTSVQGAGAAGEIVHALEQLNRQGEADVILCGRGGGSIEDLWPFNEEIVARAIRASKIPVISCVGHETDFTIADFAADLRAPTPSAAAELAVPEAAALRAAIDGLLEGGAAAIERRLTLERAHLARLNASAALNMPSRLLIERRETALERLTGRMTRAAQAMPQTKQARLDGLMRALNAVNPNAVLERGYAVVRQNGQAVTDASALDVGDLIDVTLKGGTLGARVTRHTDETRGD
ncbi:MAG: exodeoxyribonuclease VII large subunit [Clostridiales bacterium]|nr:exodeoxyribonuclease VII large subunit [Clostridiales bacterium]